MHVIIVRWQLKPEYVAVFEQTMTEHIRATRRTEPGCVQFDIAKDKTNPRTYHLFEVYRDDQALVDHARSPTLAGLREQAKEWLEDRSHYTAQLWPAITA